MHTSLILEIQIKHVLTNSAVNVDFPIPGDPDITCVLTNSAVNAYFPNPGDPDKTYINKLCT